MRVRSRFLLAVGLWTAITLAGSIAHGGEPPLFWGIQSDLLLVQKLDDHRGELLDWWEMPRFVPDAFFLIKEGMSEKEVAERLREAPRSQHVWGTGLSSSRSCYYEEADLSVSYDSEGRVRGVTRLNNKSLHSPEPK
jgi:hypothetical protein